MNETIPPTTTIVARLSADEKTARRLADAIADQFGSGDITASAFEAADNWAVEIVFGAAPDEAGLRACIDGEAGPEIARTLKFERVAAKDWVAAALADLPPVAAGRFVIHGAHDRARVAPNRIGIEIEAALAFGTGHHGTTRGCLLALDAILKARKKRPHHHPEVPGEAGPRRMTARSPFEARRLRRLASQGDGNSVLDIGTGTGILAIAAARALRSRVIASDIDVAAVRIARENARLNRTATLIDLFAAAGIHARHLRAGAPYDLIFANILVGPLLRIADEAARLLAPGGCIVLSGLLPAHANAVTAAYGLQGLVLERRIMLESWATLVMRRPQAGRRRFAHAWWRSRRPRSAR